jgi:hypothetical protein
MVAPEAGSTNKSPPEPGAAPGQRKRLTRTWSGGRWASAPAPRRELGRSRRAGPFAGPPVVVWPGWPTASARRRGTVSRGRRAAGPTRQPSRDGARRCLHRGRPRWPGPRCGPRAAEFDEQILGIGDALRRTRACGARAIEGTPRTTPDRAKPKPTSRQAATPSPGTPPPAVCNADPRPTPPPPATSRTAWAQPQQPHYLRPGRPTPRPRHRGWAATRPQQVQPGCRLAQVRAACAAPSAVCT